MERTLALIRPDVARENRGGACAKYTSTHVSEDRYRKKVVHVNVRLTVDDTGAESGKTTGIEGINYIPIASVMLID